MAIRSERFELRIDEDQLAQVDAWAREQTDRPTRAEAVRRLVNFGLSIGSSQAVHFSDGEKMLIVMMGDLFKALKVKNPELDPCLAAKIINGGHYWALKWDMQSVFHNHVDNPQNVSHVVDVLDMWSFIEEAYEDIDPEEKASIVAELGPWATNVRFPGFDGNHESSQISIARFLVDGMGRFSRFKGREMNSHSPTHARYCHMVAAFKPIRATLIGCRLSVQQLVTLLKREQ